MPPIKLDTTTALIVIDLQKGIIGREFAPYTGEQVVNNVQALAKRFRRAGAPVVLVNVGFSKDLKDVLRPEVDMPAAMPPSGYPENFSELIDGLAMPGDILITKRQWSAFYGTELDLQLRRRGIKTIVLTGVSSNMGVESTARQAWEHNYSLIIAEDATSGFSDELHNFAINKIFPRISRVVKSSDLSFISDPLPA
jgi:nicotinamidase-related amidase